jgi:hypothetical protein
VARGRNQSWLRGKEHCPRVARPKNVTEAGATATSGVTLDASPPALSAI